VRRHVVQYWEGEIEEKHHRSVSLAQCTIACRGFANRAMVTCHDWIDDRASVAKRRECASHLKEMGEYCRVTLKGPASQCTSYTKAHHQADDHECQVCGIQRYFEQHGVYGGGQSHYTTHDVSVYDNGHSEVNAVHLNDAKRKAKAVQDEEAEKSAALGLNPEVPSVPSRAHMAGQSEDYMRARFGDVLPRRAISRAVNDGASNANDVDNGDDASHLAEVHDHVFRGMTLRTAMDSQFPTCRGDERCAETCVLAARSATDACMTWLHAPPASGGDAGGNHSDTAVLGTAACADALEAARANCGPEESARCVEPLATGFHALGVPGVATLNPDPDPGPDTSASADVNDVAEEDDVEKHSRSLLNSLQRILKEKVMPDAGSATSDSSASYAGHEASWPAAEKHVALSGKGQRNWDLVSTVCRPAGVTEQDIAALCLVGPCTV